MDFKYPQTWWNLKSLPVVLYFSLWAKPSSDCIFDGEGMIGPFDHQIDLAHVQKATIAPHEDIVVAESEDESASSGVAEDSDNSWDGEGEEGDDDWSEGFDHLVEVEAGGGLAPKDVNAVAEELVTSDGDESGAAIDGLGLDLGESWEERVDGFICARVLLVGFNEMTKLSLVFVGWMKFYWLELMYIQWYIDMCDVTVM